MTDKTTKSNYSVLGGIGAKNFINIEGREIELTEEQLKQFKSVTPNNQQAEKELFEIIKSMKVQIIDENTIKYYNEKDEWMVELEYKNGRLWYSYHSIYLILQSKYSLNEQQISDLVKGMMEKFWKVKGLTPQEGLF